jgi:hypothetical protein
MSFLLSLTFSLQQNWRTRGQNKFFPEGGREVAQTMYTHVSECKNDKTTTKKDKVLCCLYICLIYFKRIHLKILDFSKIIYVLSINGKSTLAVSMKCVLKYIIKILLKFHFMF